MNEQVVRMLTWQGLPIPELAPRPTPTKNTGIESLGGGERENHTSKFKTPEFENDTMSHRVSINPANRVKPSAPPMTEDRAFSTLEGERTRPSAQGVQRKALPTKSVQTVKFSGIDEEMSGHTSGKKSFDHNRKVRPSNFQKWVKKYNGSGDPYDHLASFKQVVRAEQVNDFHTKVEGFGLTLEGHALSWFQTLNVTEYLTYEDLEKDFIAAFSKTGLKHDVLSQIHGFKQKSDESVRDGANRLRQYLARCPEEEMPS